MMEKDEAYFLMLGFLKGLSGRLTSIIEARGILMIPNNLIISVIKDIDEFVSEILDKKK